MKPRICICPCKCEFTPPDGRGKHKMFATKRCQENDAHRRYRLRQRLAARDRVPQPPASEPKEA